MAIIEDGYGKSPAGETAQQKAERKWKNHEVSRRYRLELALCRPPEPEKTITPTDGDIETREQRREQRRAKRLKTTRDLKNQIKHLEEVVRSGRGAVSEIAMTGYLAQLERQKRRLLVEKLRRLEANHI